MSSSFLCPASLPVLLHQLQPCMISGGPAAIGLDAPSTRARCRRAPPAARSSQGRRGFGSPDSYKTARTEEAAPQSSGNGEDEVPQEVFDRVLRRVLIIVATPMVTAVALLFALGALKNGGVIAVPPWLPLVIMLLGFGSSAFGIAYGTLSASWDADRKGSLLGFDEAKKNWPLLWKEDDDDQ